MLDRSAPEPIRSPLLDAMAEAGVRHGFFTRAGGVSEGLYNSLNVGLGSQDLPANVRENRSRVARWMGVPETHLNTLYQVHSADVLTVSDALAGERPRADGLVTNRPGIALGVLTADCGPILLAEPQAGVIGAAHAGWQGALHGVAETTIAAMERLGARRDRIAAVLGPSISQTNYEVGPEFHRRFLDVSEESGIYFEPSARQDHFLFDLNRYTVDRLRAAGVKAKMVGRCTYAEENLFFSYRRATHRKEPDYGRQISAIVIEDS